jgi:hypothetical protein
MPATAADLQTWMVAAGWPRLVTYSLLATALHGALITLIIQRRDLSSLDHFVFLYLVVHLAVDALRLLVGLVILLRRGAPRLANLQDCEFPALTVVVPCHNESEVIGETIRSLQAVDYPDLRIIVVDDGSSDGTAAIAAACRPPCAGDLPGSCRQGRGPQRRPGGSGNTTHLAGGCRLPISKRWFS